MTLSELLEEKRKNNLILKSNYFSKNKIKTIALLNITNIDILQFLIDGLQYLPVNFICIGHQNIFQDYIYKNNNIIFVNSIPKDLESGIDFVIGDSETDNLKYFINKGVTPILPENNYLSSVLSEFNPIKVSGNSYLYKEENHWCIFYAVVRYLENYKFPYDNRNLIKNLLEI